MVLVELSDIEDPEERERYIEFLAENDVEFVQSRDGGYFTAHVQLLQPSLGAREDAKSVRTAASRSSLNNGTGMSESGRRSSYISTGTSAGSLPGKLKTIVKGARPSQETRRMLHAFHQSNAVSEYSCYAKFCSLIESRDALEPRDRPLKWVLSLINEIYEERSRFVEQSVPHEETEGVPIALAVARNKTFVEAGQAAGQRHDPQMLQNFPVFVMDHLSKRYGLRRIVDQVSWDLVFNVHTLRRSRLLVEIFARFLEEYYDGQDLVFFLLVKAAVDQVIQKGVRTSWTKEFYNSKQRSNSAIKHDVQVFLKWHEVVTVARTIYGSHSPNDEYSNFLELVDEHCTNLDSAQGDLTKEQEQSVEATQLLHLAVAQFHDTRAQLAERRRKSSNGSSQTGEREFSSENLDSAMGQVFQSAQDSFRQRMAELSFAESIAEETIGQNAEQKRQLDEMCTALKSSLLENDQTRNALASVNEKTIRDWGLALLSQQVNLDASVRSTASSEGKYAEQITTADSQDERIERESIKPGSPQSETASLSTTGDYQKTPASNQDSSFTSSFSSRENNTFLKPEVLPIQKLLVSSKTGAMPQSISPPVSPPPPPPMEPPPQDLPFYGNPPTLGDGTPTYSASISPDALTGRQQLGDTEPWRSSFSGSWTKTRKSPPSYREQQLVVTRSQNENLETYAKITPPGFQSPPTRSLAPTEMVVREIQGCLARAKEDYMESLMVAAKGLPPGVVLEIEKEVRSQLDKKTRTMVTDVIGGSKSSKYMYECTAVPDSCSLSQLESEFKTILRVFNESSGSYFHMSKQVEEFCSHLLSSTEIRQEIEPLVALLVTYASARLGSNTKQPSNA